jgi:hypothetical protein
MNWLNKLPNSRREASGLEWTIWRKLPLVLVVGSVLLLISLGLVHLFYDVGHSAADARQVRLAGYVVLGAILFHWYAVAVVAVGCVIVMLMKGPGYVADAYALPHADKPRPNRESVDEANRRRSCAQGGRQG